MPASFVFAKLMNDLITNVLEAYQTIKIQHNSLFECILCILLLIGVEMLGNNHTPCGESIALHQNTPQFKALGFELGFFAVSHSKTWRTFLMKSG